MPSRHNKERLFKVMEKVDETFRPEKKVIDENADLSNLNEILDGYIDAALWTEEERLMDDYKENFSQENDEYDPYDEEGESTEEIKFLRIMKNKTKKKNVESFSREDIDHDSLIKAYEDIKKFMEFAGDDAINEAINEYGFEQLGHDIWLTRNGHGAGFFDHSYDNEKILMDAAKKLGEVDLYLTDDITLAFSNEHQ